MHGSCWFLITFGCVLLGGCRDRATTPAAPTNAVAPAESQVYLSHAQPPLPTVKIWVGAAELTTELAVTPQQVATGMMFRTNLAENAGMLFVFNQPHRAAFYMRNTQVPLSAAYIDPEGAILEIVELKPHEERPVVAQSDQVQYVLEVNRNWFDRHQIRTGMVMRTEYGSFPRTFRRR